MGLLNRKKSEGVVCPQCSQVNPVGVAECDMCGVNLQEALAPTGSAPQPAES